MSQETKSLVDLFVDQANANAGKSKEQLTEGTILSVNITTPTKGEGGVEYPRYRMLVNMNGATNNIWVFQNSVEGVTHSTFIPKQGIAAVFSLVPNSYERDKEDGSGKETINTFKVRQVKADSMSAKLAAIKQSGLSNAIAI